MRSVLVVAPPEPITGPPKKAPKHRLASIDAAEKTERGLGGRLRHAFRVCVSFRQHLADPRRDHVTKLSETAVG